MKDAIGVVVVMLFAFAAFDDITTDNDIDFTVEYAVLVACALWLCVTSIRLLRSGHRTLGSVSLVALAAVLWGQRGIEQGWSPDSGPSTS